VRVPRVEVVVAGAHQHLRLARDGRHAGLQRGDLDFGGHRQEGVDVIAGDDDHIEPRRCTDQPVVLAQPVMQVRGQQYAHQALYSSPTAGP
jgi:hypothetical protein